MDLLTPYRSRNPLKGIHHIVTSTAYFWYRVGVVALVAALGFYGVIDINVSGLRQALAESVQVQLDVDYQASNAEDQDDPAIWIHPEDPGQSVVIGSDKSADRIFVYSLSGSVLHTVNAPGKPGNIDVRYNIPFNGSFIDVVGVNDRDNDTIVLYAIDEDTRALTRIDTGSIETGSNYGFCFYHDQDENELYGFITSKPGDISQFRLFDDGSGSLTGTQVREWEFSGQTEGCVVDDELSVAYFGEEEEGIWKIGAKPHDSTPGTQIVAIGDDDFEEDVEGLALYKTSESDGYLIASSQGSDTFYVYDREAPHDLAGVFSIDGAESTDGIEATPVSVGQQFGQSSGFFVAHDGGDGLMGVAWAEIAGELGLVSNSNYNPRGDSDPNPDPDPQPDPEPEFQLNKSVNEERAQAGDVLTYTLQFSNTSDVVARNVVVSDTVPAGTEYVAQSLTGPGEFNVTANAVVWEYATISANTQHTVSFQVRVLDSVDPNPNPDPQPGPDETVPTVSIFSVTPSVTNQSFTVSWSVTDDTQLASVSVLRAAYVSGLCDESTKSGCQWSEVYGALIGGIAHQQSVNNTPEAPGSYFYGIHVADAAQNIAMEPTPPGPILVEYLGETQSGDVYTEQEFKVAFIGDQGLGSAAENVLDLIASEGTDMVLHQGDFDYEDDPEAWDEMITDRLGANFPYFASVGNHDEDSWDGSDGYQQLLMNRLSRVSGANCVGEYGVNAECTYRGLSFILSGAGTMGFGHESFIRSALSGNDHAWKICSWHKNQREMQIGSKSSDVGWGPYETCREFGAIMATGHEHSYSRTKTLSNTQQQIVDTSCADDPATDQVDVCVAPNQSFVFVSGLAGRSIRDQERCSPTTYPYGCNGEWASIYSSDQDAVHGALFIEFYVDGDPNKARGYFKNIDGEIIDEFFVTRKQ